MNLSRIVTENPKEEQWRLLSRYVYGTNIRRFLDKKGHHDASDALVDFVAGSIQQGRAYFAAAEAASLDISPLLIYYGAANILVGAATMLTGVRPAVHEHGMKLRQPSSDLMATVEILPVDHVHGALQLLTNIFSDNCQLTNSGKWTLDEILASVPDVRLEYLNQYAGPPFTIPLEVVPQKRGTLERSPHINLDRFNAPDEMFECIDGLKKAYLRPQYGAESGYLILYRKPSGPDIGIYSISGQKHLRIGHAKHGHLLNPNPVILMFMGLFALGYLRWTPLSRQLDETF